jgi:hypothetical protein
MVSTKVKVLAFAVAFVAVQVAGVATATAYSTDNNGRFGTKSAVVTTANEAPKNVPGNNGTLKVHELGTALGFEDNAPKVCKFNLEGFGFDQAQSGYIMFEAQGGGNNTAVSDGNKYNFGPTDATGYAISQDFNNGGATLANGQYKATLYGKDTGQNIDLSDVKAKSKVFRVTCETTTPENPGGEVLGEETGGKGGPAPVTTANEPGTLQDTGTSLVASAFGVAFIASAFAAMRSKVAEKIDFDLISL